MVARLLLALLLALGALPAAAMPVGCHGVGAMGAMTMGDPAAATPDTPHRPHHAPPVEHRCIGCAAIGALDHPRVAPPALAPMAPAIGILARLIMGTSPPPTPRPPRIG